MMDSQGMGHGVTVATNASIHALIMAMEIHLFALIKHINNPANGRARVGVRALGNHSTRRRQQINL
jgi:hypothetical protein